MIGARYIAAERGAFDVLEPVLELLPDAPAMAATATLAEIAAAHDGQPAAEWMRFFLSVWREYGDRD